MSIDDYANEQAGWLFLAKLGSLVAISYAIGYLTAMQM